MPIDLTLYIYILLTSQATFLSFEGEQKVFFLKIKELGPAVITTPRRAQLDIIKRRKN